MKHYTCYLSGPITGHGFDEVTSWREWVRKQLDPHVKGLNPMRGKEYLENTKSLELKYDEHIMSTAGGIYGRDFWDTMRCDVMLVNVLGMPYDAPSLGTVIEIGWFTTRSNPLVICGEPDNPIVKHPLCSNRATYIAHKLSDAVACVNALFSDER